MKILVLNLAGSAMDRVTNELGTKAWYKNAECSDEKYNLWDIELTSIVKINPEYGTIWLDTFKGKSDIRENEFEIIKIM